MGCGGSTELGPQPQNNGNNNNNNRRGGHQNQNGNFTMPLQQPLPWSSGQPVSREGLDLKRDEFWTTRVTGREEIWGAIKLASELLINNDVDMANQILLAAEVTTPSGTLAVCYDRLGNKYEVEAYCYSNPIKFQEGHVEKAGGGKTKERTDDSDPGADMVLRMRTSIREIEMKVNTHQNERVCTLKKILAEATANYKPNSDNEVPKEFPLEVSKMRFLCHGYELKKDNATLDMYNVKDNDVVQVMVRQ